MEVYTCDSGSYVICRNLAFLMLDLETSGLLYSAMFCINQKNAFLIYKNNVFFLITKAIPLKNRENQTSYHYCTFVAHLADENR